MRLLIAVFLLSWFFLPDANSFVSYTDGNGNLFLWNVSTDNVEQVTNIGFSREHTWSPDGTQIVYQMTASIIIYDIESDAHTPIVESETTTQYLHPRWSPDGRYIAFASHEDGDWDIYTYELDTETITNITQTDFDDGNKGFDWLSDSEHIIFVRDGDIRFDETADIYVEDTLHITNLNGTIDEVIHQINPGCMVGEVFFNPRWHPVSNQFAITASCGGGDSVDIYTVNRDVDEPHIINMTNGAYLQAGFRGIAWFGCGEGIAFIALVEDDTTSDEVLSLMLDTADNSPVIEQLTDSPRRTRYNGMASYSSIGC